MVWILPIILGNEDFLDYSLTNGGMHAVTRFLRFDTLFGMAVSNIVALAIMISTVAALHAAGKLDIQRAGDAAKALESVAGKFAFALFSLAIVDAGLLAIPVLVGSAAYAVGESQGGKCGLDNKPGEAARFYAAIAAAMVIGPGIDSGIDPIKVLFGVRSSTALSPCR